MVRTTKARRTATRDRDREHRSGERRNERRAQQGERKRHADHRPDIGTGHDTAARSRSSAARAATARQRCASAEAWVTSISGTATLPKRVDRLADRIIVRPAHRRSARNRRSGRVSRGGSRWSIPCTAAPARAPRRTPPRAGTDSRAPPPDPRPEAGIAPPVIGGRSLRRHPAHRGRREDSWER